MTVTDMADNNVDLIEELPKYYDSNLKMEELQKLLSIDINLLASTLNETIDQCYIDTVTTMLSRYETIYGISVDISQTDDYRRERIKAKIRGVGTITKQMLINAASAYSNAEVEVIENVNDYSFVIKFVGSKGIPLNMSNLQLTIDEIKPAHLNYTFEYTYNTWSDISAMTWALANTFTWEELKVR